MRCGWSVAARMTSDRIAEPIGRDTVWQPTALRKPDYFHKVVDGQWACPAHTPVPEYIRLIAEQRYTEAWAINWESNVFPGILGRTCDRPCEPACRRSRVEAEPVAICRLKRVAADNKGDISPYLPAVPKQKNGKRIALVGAGPASLTVARGRELEIPGRQEAAANIHIGIDWLSSVSFGHIDKIGRRVIVLGGGNTAMDCCRSSRRLGGEEVTVVVRSGFEEMKASVWEKEDAMHEGIPILNFLVPVEFTHDNGKLTGVLFEKVKAEFDEKGRRNLVPTGEPHQHILCDDVLVAIGQENAFPWIERDVGIEFDRWGMPKVDPKTMQSSLPNVFFGGDAAFGPKNIIWAVAHGHDAAISIDKMCHGEDVGERPAPGVTLASQKMGIHEWSYDNDISNDQRFKVPLRDLKVALHDIRTEVELGYDDQLAFLESERCLNCDIQTVFAGPLCIECDACVNICPMDCITFTENGEEEDLRGRLSAPALELTQDLYIGNSLKTGRIMVKDEDVCLHCGLCAERCPTGAWDMAKFLLNTTQAGPACRSR